MNDETNKKIEQFCELSEQLLSNLRNMRIYLERCEENLGEIELLQERSK